VRSAGELGRRLLPVARDVWDSTWRDDVPFYAAGIAFHSLFSIFSLLFMLSLILGQVGQDPEALRSLAGFAANLFPAKAAEFMDTVLEIVARPVPSGLLPLALLFTLWTSSNVIQALIHALNRIYHLRQNTRPFWKTRLMAMGVVGASVLLLLLGFALLVFGRDLTRNVAPVGRILLHPLAWALAMRQLLSVVAVFLGVLLLYWLAPNFRHTHRVSWPGALAFAVVWAPTTLGFNVYLREVAVYDKVYGPMATVVVVLTWVYLSAFLCLVGGEINAAIHRYRGRKTAKTG
jgi:membrane protein